MGSDYINKLLIVTIKSLSTIFFFASSLPDRGTSACNARLSVSILFMPSCDVPLITGSPTHSCPGPSRLGLSFSYVLRERMTDEDRVMMVRELRAALTSMEANSDVQVVLFKHDGTSEVFELEEVLSNDGHAQLEIYEAEPVREENPEG